jgi:hypothetical protein
MVAFVISVFFGTFFEQRAAAYSFAVTTEVSGFISLMDGVGVYVYMAFSALLSAAFIYFIGRAFVTVSAYRFGISVDRKEAGLYLVIFASAANILCGFFGLLFIAFPYIFINFTMIIRFAVMTVGYLFFIRFYIGEYIPKKYALPYFKGLALIYFVVNIGYFLVNLIVGGVL